MRTTITPLATNHHHVHITVLSLSPRSPQSVHFPDSLAAPHKREWLTNSSAHPRTAPFSSNPKSSTAYLTGEQHAPAPRAYHLSRVCRVHETDNGHVAVALHRTHPIQQYSTISSMSSDSSNLSSLTREKLNKSVSRQDSNSLHRWVLLRNSMLASPSQTQSTFSNTQPETSSAYPNDDGDDDDDDADEVLGLSEIDSFMFPDAGQLVRAPVTAGAKTSEAQWLDSLLETLGDDEDYDDFIVDSDPQNAALPADDDEFQLYSPTGSPSSSSEDLPNQPAYYPSSISVQYPVPYPPLIHAYHFASPFDSLVSPALPPYDSPFPYHDIEDLQVPDAIDDTSDDESDAPTTPSLGRSTSSVSLLDAASIPLPAERSRLRDANPRVYVNSDDSYFYPFEFDPLPFPDEQLRTSYNHYQEC